MYRCTVWDNMTKIGRHETTRARDDGTDVEESQVFRGVAQDGTTPCLPLYSLLKRPTVRLEPSRLVSPLALWSIRKLGLQQQYPSAIYISLSVYEPSLIDRARRFYSLLHEHTRAISAGQVRATFRTANINFAGRHPRDTIGGMCYCTLKLFRGVEIYRVKHIR